MQPVATPPELIDNLRRDLETIVRAEVAKYNERRAEQSGGVDVEYLIHPDQRVRLISHTRQATLLIDISADELAINIVLAKRQEAHPGYPKQVPLRVILEAEQPVLQTAAGTASPHEVLTETLAEYFRVLES
jgi:hypothetical protein